MPGAHRLLRHGIPVLLALCGGLACAELAGQERDALVIRQLDVGQGDAAVIRTPDRKIIVIDAGRSAHAVVGELQSLGVDTIDLLVASHNHIDHIGGMATLLHSFVVRAYLDNGIPHSTATYRRTVYAVRVSGAQYLQARPRRIDLGAVKLRVLSLPPRAADQNNNSVGLIIEYGRFRALYTGDSELYELRHWLLNDSVPAVTIVKSAHHGSWNGLSPEWARATRPRAVLVSVGARNSYGHPAMHVLELWDRAGAQVLRTDWLGTIEIRADSTGSFTVSHERMVPHARTAR